MGRSVPRRWKVLPPVHQILIGLESAIPFLLLQTSTSFIDSVWNRHQVSQLPSLPFSLSIPPPRPSGDKWGTGYAAGFSVGDHLTAAACWCTHCTSAPPLPHQPRLGRVTSPACCQRRVFEEKTARHVNRFIRFSRFHQGICQYEHPHHRHPPPTITIMIPGLITCPTVMVSADRQQVIETNRSLRNIKNVSPPLSLTCPSPYRH